VRELVHGAQCNPATMRALPLARSLPRTLATRAATLWVLVRMLIGVVFLLARTGGGAAPRPNPVLVIAICTIVGIVDLRRRGEETLWSNLGVSRTQLVLVFVATAIVGEIVLALVLS
jgi:hypothetical protein